MRRQVTISITLQVALCRISSCGWGEFGRCQARDDAVCAAHHAPHRRGEWGRRSCVGKASRPPTARRGKRPPSRRLIVRDGASERARARRAGGPGTGAPVSAALRGVPERRCRYSSSGAAGSSGSGWASFFGRCSTFAGRGTWARTSVWKLGRAGGSGGLAIGLVFFGCARGR